MNMKKRGIIMLEAVLAAGLAGGMLVGVCSLIQGSTSGAELVGQDVVARTTVFNVLALLSRAPLADLRRTSGPAGKPYLAALIAVCLLQEGSPDPTLADGLSATLEEDLPGKPGLVRLRLALTDGPGRGLKLERLLRAQ